MYEKVNPCHPDKVADRIAGAIVDLAYEMNDNPKIAVEVLIGHNECFVIIEADTIPNEQDMNEVIHRITESNNVNIRYKLVPQDEHLAGNQKESIKCGDNGIFKGIPATLEEKMMTSKAKELYDEYKADGKYILDNHDKEYIICQSHAEDEIYDYFKEEMYNDYKVIVNPLGYWTGGINVDSGATNRKLGSDMGGAVTGGGLHGKDLSKADVSVNIYVHMWAEQVNKTVEAYCAIGDSSVRIIVDGTEIHSVPYHDIVTSARTYIKSIGGFEKFAEWGLIR